MVHTRTSSTEPPKKVEPDRPIVNVVPEPERPPAAAVCDATECPSS